MPEQCSHFFSGDIAPAEIDIAFIAAFVNDNGFGKCLPPFRDKVHIVVLDAGVGERGIVMIVPVRI